MLELSCVGGALVPLPCLGCVSTAAAGALGALGAVSPGLRVLRLLCATPALGSVEALRTSDPS
jgi:hypothetical protein